tara:strand:- start:841 stop:1107 length:267 start_codon:yes stop_codon:yes gene_type:complete
MNGITLTPAQLEEMLDRSAKKGARAALEELGLHDGGASGDINEIRGLLAAWRDTRTTFRRTFVKMATSAVLIFITGAVWLSFKNEIGR